MTKAEVIALAKALGGGGGGGSITVDDQMDGMSVHPVQNKVIKAAIDALASDMDGKANIDGYYESLTSGNAEQLVSTVGVTDMVPYNFRTSGGSADIGDREVDEIVGGTVAWNQIIPSVRKSGSVTFDEDTAVYNYYVFTDMNVPVQSGHKIIFGCKITRTISTNNFLGVGLWDQLAHNIGSVTVNNNAPDGYAYKIVEIASDATKIARVSFNNYNGKRGFNAGDSMSFDDFTATDLTAMFGSTIADYIYSLEQGTAGAGVAWFRKYFPKPYYAYEAGKLESVNVSAHKTVGYNAWDEEWEVGAIDIDTGADTPSINQIRSKNYIPIVPQTVYYFKCGSLTSANAKPRYYDANKNYIGTGTTVALNSTFTTPANACFFRFGMQDLYGTTYKNDICISLYWDGERAGEYEPYNLHTYPLDFSLTLRGIPKLDANNELYYDGDTYASDGTVTRKYMEYTFTGEEEVYSWTSDAHRGGVTFPSGSTVRGNCKGGANTNGISSDGKLYCSYANANNAYYLSTDSTRIIVTDDTCATASDLLARLTGVTFLFELTTPITESADPYQNPQIVDDWGTEEYVDYAESQGTRDVAIPVGHTTKYQANLRAKLEMLPNSPSDGDGDYVVRQTGGINEFVKLVKELPTAPAEDGTYSLKCTVSSGTATLAWVADE